MNKSFKIGNKTISAESPAFIVAEISANRNQDYNRALEIIHAAKEAGADYFTTTLTISPLKNASKINEIGDRIGGMADIAFLPSDFKKKNGYKRSVELSKEYDLYRQDYCGCVFSRR